MDSNNKETKLFARITKDEKKLIKDKAKSNGMKMSEFIRYAVLAVDAVEVKITTEIKIKR